ncbi:MAG: DegT/DnrJ/EryC1/StrS family aminotransferase [Clostridia bacterium]|nr:DegT/DnrJ/EryC1/StrS family aminotransferase [Clostridia bacterium]
MYRIGKEEIDAVARVIESKELFKVNGGPYHETENFEKEIREKLDTKYSVLMTSGVAAMTAALIGMGIGPGDQVIVPGYTYIASAMAVVAAGAIPVLCEVDDTLTIDPDDIRKKITKHTKAIIPVHIQGYPCNMDAVTEIAKEYGLLVLEDACQADGGSYKGRRLGTIGDAGAFSFNFFKVITAGEGGALVTDDEDIFRRAMIYHDASAIAYFGNQLDDIEKDSFCGTEFRTDEIKAAILRVQLTKMDGILKDLRSVKTAVAKAVEGKLRVIRSNDADGDCATTITFSFDTADEAVSFAEKSGGVRPIDTGKHVYSRWTPIIRKRGAFNPLMDPFRMEANKDIVPEYTEDMCPKTLEILSKCVHINLNPDWTAEQIGALADKLIGAVK